MAVPRVVQVSNDPETHMWWAESDDLPGLVSEAPGLDGLCDRVMLVIEDLLAANGPAVVTPEFRLS